MNIYEKKRKIEGLLKISELFEQAESGRWPPSFDLKVKALCLSYGIDYAEIRQYYQTVETVSVPNKPQRQTVTVSKPIEPHTTIAERNCQWCNKPFAPSKTSQIFCSVHCGSRYRVAKQRGKLTNLKIAV